MKKKTGWVVVALCLSALSLLAGGTSGAVKYYTDPAFAENCREFLKDFKSGQGAPLSYSYQPHKPISQQIQELIYGD